jgi:CRISPR type I-E-associated protein CasB/Cse2
MTEHTALPPYLNETADSKDDNRDTRFVQHLLELRVSSAAARSALRRGDQKALSRHALTYLAPWFTKEWEIDAALLFAAALATHDNVGHVSEVPVGHALYFAIEPRPREATDTNLGRRVLAMQRQTLPLAHRTLTGALRVLDDAHRSIDWLRLWRMYRGWNHPTPEIQRRVRRQILLDFYGADRASLTNN